MELKPNPCLLVYNIAYSSKERIVEMIYNSKYNCGYYFTRKTYDKKNRIKKVEHKTPGGKFVTDYLYYYESKNVIKTLYYTSIEGIGCYQPIYRKFDNKGRLRLITRKHSYYYEHKLLKYDDKNNVISIFKRRLYKNFYKGSWDDCLEREYATNELHSLQDLELKNNGLFI